MVGRELRQQHPSDLSVVDIPAPDNKSLECCCSNFLSTMINPLINSLMQKRCNPGALALELHLSCMKSSVSLWMWLQQGFMVIRVMNYFL